MNDDAGTVEDRVRKVLLDYVKNPETEITLDAAFVDLGLDSLDGLEMMFDLESEFDVAIPDEVAGEIKTVRQAVEGIERLQAAENDAGGEGGSTS